MSKLTFLLLAPLAQLCSSGAVDKEAEDAKALTTILPQSHYSHPAIDDAFSQTMLVTYLDLLDPAKLYFEADDIARLTEQFGSRLDDDLKAGNLSCAAIATTILKTRMQERSAWIDRLSKEPINFTLDELLPKQLSAWQTHEEALETWRKIYKNAVTQLLIHTASQADARKQAALQNKRRFSRMLKLSEDDAEAILLNASLRTCDPHSDYMPAPKAVAYEQGLSNTFIGIGISLKLEPSSVYAVITSVIPGSPASREPTIVPGVQIALVEVEGKLVATEEMDAQELVSYIKGPKGSKVRLGLLPADTLDTSQMQFVELTRAEIVQEEGKAKATSKQVSGLNLAVITLPSFYVGCANDVQSLLQANQEAQGLVLDLRNNGGGIVEECAKLTGLFIPTGIIAQQKGYMRAAWQDSNPSYCKLPLVVLISQYTASASEILAGALQDYQRAVIVGSEHTFGKGSVQGFIPLDSQAQIKLTLGQYFLPSGKSTQFGGVRADIVLPSLDAVEDVGEAYLPNALKSEPIGVADFKPLGLITPDLLNSLRMSSAERTSKNAEKTEEIILEEALNIVVDLYNTGKQ